MGGISGSFGGGGPTRSPRTSRWDAKKGGLVGGRGRFRKGRGRGQGFGVPGGGGGVQVPGQWGGMGGGGGGYGSGSSQGGKLPKWGPGGGYGGGGGGGGAPHGTEALTLKAQPSPQMQEATKRFEEHAAWLREQAGKVDENLQSQIEMYKERMGEGPTTRAIERASSGIRDFAAGQAADAERRAAMQGRGQGFGAAGLGESAQRMQAGAAADISLGREAQLDNLLATGTQIMGAPGQRELAYAGLGSQFYGMNPYAQSANLGLAEKGLGLQAWMAPRELGIREMEAQSRAYGSPIDWYRMVFS